MGLTQPAPAAPREHRGLDGEGRQPAGPTASGGLEGDVDGLCRAVGQRMMETNGPTSTLPACLTLKSCPVWSFCPYGTADVDKHSHSKEGTVRITLRLFSWGIRIGNSLVSLLC